MLNTSDKLLSICGIFHYVKGFLIYFITASMVRNEDDVKLVTKILLVAAVLESLVYIPENILRIGRGSMNEVLFRAKGTMDSTSVTATFLSSILLMALGVRFVRIRSSLKLFAAIAFLIGIPALMFTFVRASYISFSLSTLLGILYGLRRKWAGLGIIVKLSVTVGIAVLILWPMISLRLSADHAAAFEERTNLMKIAWNIIEDHPIIGLGINTYNERYKAYIPESLMEAWLYPVHNQYLLIWAETGTLGFSMFVWFLVAVLKKGIRSVKSRDDLLAPLAFGFLLGFMAILFDMFWGLYASEQATSHICFFAGMIAAIERLDTGRELRQKSSALLPEVVGRNWPILLISQKSKRSSL